MPLQNDVILRTAQGESVGRTPVWLMRQAGRILPQYRAVRAKLSGFKELVETPELAAEVTIQPVDELGVDAAIIFSDILVIPDAMGLSYQVVEKKGPVFPETIKSVNDLERLKIPDPQVDLKYVLVAIQIAKEQLAERVPLIGFAGAPLTIFSYMLEGSGSKTFSVPRRFLYAHPEASRKLLEMITESTIRYLKAQISAGVDLVQIFDSWAGIYAPEQYLDFGISSIQKICMALREDPVSAKTPIIVFAKGAYGCMAELGQIDCDVLGLDWGISVQRAKSEAGEGKVYQGNLDPCLLYANPELIKSKTEKMLIDFGKDHHIANLGHGVYPDTPLENVKVFVDTVKQFRF